MTTAIRHVALSYLDAEAIEPMTEEQTFLFMKCRLIEVHSSGLFDAARAKDLDTGGEILRSRLDWGGGGDPCRLSVGLACFVLAGLSEGNRGNLVMWALVLHRLYRQKRAPLTMDDFAEAFPVGFPTAGERDRVWDAQKTHTGNSVDSPETWNS